MVEGPNSSPTVAPTLDGDNAPAGRPDWNTGAYDDTAFSEDEAAEHADLDDVQPGRVLAARYRLTERLGAGAHGEVWSADDLVLRERCALKWMRHAGRYPARVRREITTLRMLRVPGVVRLLDEGIEDGLPFLVMERVEGRPFPGQAAGARWTWGALAHPTLALLEVLSRVHAAGVVHRDLKPDNILVNAAGQPTVLDFGISLWQDPINVGRDSAGPSIGVGRVSASAGSSIGRLTEAGQILGTPRYLAPEQILGGVVDARTDIYAVGVMLYEALTGRGPHEAPDVMSLLRTRLVKPALPLGDLAPEVPSIVAGVIDRLLQTRPEQRYRSATEALAALRGERASSPAEPALPRLGGRRALDEAALRPLFAGPDCLFHLREDAARALWQRTEGLPARVEAEITLWTRLGLARWDGPLLAIDREALDRLSAGLAGAAPAQGHAEGLSGEPHLEELLQWLSLGGHHLEIGQIAEAMGRPLWKIEAGCEALLARGAARLADRHIVPRGQVDLTWTSGMRLEAHRAIAGVMRPGQEGRLFHLLAAEDAPRAATEAVEVARQRARDGNIGAAAAALAEGLHAARYQDGGGGDAELLILSLWVKIAFADGTPRALDRVLYELSRARRGPEVQRLDTLVRARIAARGAGGARALELAAGIGPFEDPELERWRHHARMVFAATRASPAAIEEALIPVAAWAEASGEPLARLCLIGGQAALRYAEGRFEEAAALHAAAAEREPWITGRIDVMVKRSSALLEAFRHGEAAEQAAAARELAARCRHAYWEGRAAWMLRAARYRMGELGAPDRELLDAVARLGVPVLEALACLTEAAVAYRAEPAAGAALSQRAAALWKALDRPWGVLLSRCLALACGAPAEGGEVRALAEQAPRCPLPGIGVQALGLLGQTFPEARGTFRHAVEGLVEGVPRAHWDKRMDVLSVEEALCGAFGAAPAV